MLAGIKEVLIISTPNDLPQFKQLLGDGSEIGMKFEYRIQPRPNGLAEAFILGASFIGKDDVCLILGDNIFYGDGLIGLLEQSIKRAKSEKEATVFGYYVNNPSRYGVAQFDDLGKVISVKEKPKEPKSNYAITGLYFFPNDVVEKAKKVKPSPRNELEIVDVIALFLEENRVNVELMGRGYAWLDTGTHESLLEASMFIQTIEKRQGLKIACIEEIAYDMGYISKEKLLALAKPLSKNQYGQYLIKRLNR